MVGSKLYEVTDIDFWDLMIEARECDLGVDDVSEEEVFSIEQFKDFRIRLINGGDKGAVIDFEKWKKDSLKCQ